MIAMRELLAQAFRQLKSVKCASALQLILMLLWGTALSKTDAYYIIYLVLFTAAVLCFVLNIQRKEYLFCKNHGTYCDVLVICFALFFSLMITLANYNLCTNMRLLFVIFAGGSVSFWHLFNVIATGTSVFTWKSSSGRLNNPKSVFALSFAIIVLINSFVLFLAKYPGVLSPDSISQVRQLLSGNYSNHHPYYHTQTIRAFMMIGLKLFGDINAAVATYSFFQILFMAFCFSYAACTMAMIGAQRWILSLMIAFYAFMPYHIMYSITMWKDVMFGGFVLLFIVGVFRCFRRIGNMKLNYAALAISSMGTCLFRSNGFFAFVLLFALFFLIWKLQEKKMLAIFLCAILLSAFMKHNVLDMLNVRPPDTIEHLSIPAQQIARVVQKERTLSEWERTTLEKIIDIEQIPEKYRPWISDPIKTLVRQKGNQNIIAENKQDYIKLYLSLGCKYPLDYLIAWINQTKGYWNAGYDYWRWRAGVKENNLGIARTVRSSFVDKCLSLYLKIWTSPPMILCLSIGLFVWIDMVMLFVGLTRKDKLGAFIALPALCVVLSLLVSTPVAYEFRYIYALFCSLPTVMLISLRPLPAGQSSFEGECNG